MKLDTLPARGMDTPYGALIVEALDEDSLIVRTKRGIEEDTSKLLTDRLEYPVESFMVNGVLCLYDSRWRREHLHRARPVWVQSSIQSPLRRVTDPSGLNKPPTQQMMSKVHEDMGAWLELQYGMSANLDNRRFLSLGHVWHLSCIYSGFAREYDNLCRQASEAERSAERTQNEMQLYIKEHPEVRNTLEWKQAFGESDG